MLPLSGLHEVLKTLLLVSAFRLTSERVLEGDTGSEFSDVDPRNPCFKFTHGFPEKMEFTSPNYPDPYPNHTDCMKVIQADPGHVIKLDFREKFILETDCRYDYLEVRDGGHGYSKLIGLYCGSNFPPMITSKGKFLWLRFKSDENIEYGGFRAVYSFVPKPSTENIPDMENCRMEVSGIEGYVNRSDVDPVHVKASTEHGIPLDCMWVIRVQEGWRIQLNFNKFQLAVPNDCESNFVDIFAERTDLPSRLHNFCGSIAELVLSPGNVLQLRFLAGPKALGSNFEALYTAFRDKPKGNYCGVDEYDCEDGNCISVELKCNGRINCRFRWDEDPALCQSKQGVLSTILNAEHMIIILVVFFLILTGMCFAFLFNCFRKLIRDHRTIQEHMRMSREGRLEAVGNNRSVGGVTVVGGDCYVPEMLMVDSQCQTRESLFNAPPAPQIPPPPVPPPLPPPGFTTFGYSPGSSEVGDGPRATSMESTKSAPDVIMTH